MIFLLSFFVYLPDLPDHEEGENDDQDQLGRDEAIHLYDTIVDKRHWIGCGELDDGCDNHDEHNQHGHDQHVELGRGVELVLGIESQVVISLFNLRVELKDGVRGSHQEGLPSKESSNENTKRKKKKNEEEERRKINIMTSWK